MTARETGVVPGEKREGRVLFLIDEGWRHEKQEILRWLKKDNEFDIVTHDVMSERALQKEHNVRRIKYEKPRGLRYSILMFFASELDTQIVRRNGARRIRSRSLPLKVLFHVRQFFGRIGLRRYGYPKALDIMYRDSMWHGDLLKGYEYLVFSPVEVQDKRIIFEARNRGVKIICWVYSWDNPFKDNEFYPYAEHYLVWNRDSAEDLKRIFRVPEESIHVVGPVQFDFFKGRRGQSPDPDNPYVLYTCSTGQDFFIEQEIVIIKKLREIIDSVRKDVRLVVRPYPFRKEMNSYGGLDGAAGIEVRHFGNADGNRVIIDEKVMDEKFEQIDRAECIVNFGSTIGLEASFTDTPILQLAYSYPYDGPRCQSLKEVLKNDHFKYLLDYELPNTIVSEEALRESIGDIVSGRKKKYMKYSEKLRNFADPVPGAMYRDLFSRTLREITAP